MRVGVRGICPFRSASFRRVNVDGKVDVVGSLPVGWQPIGGHNDDVVRALALCQRTTQHTQKHTAQ